MDVFQCSITLIQPVDAKENKLKNIPHSVYYMAFKGDIVQIIN
jgi:hypothetical protein